MRVYVGVRVVHVYDEVRSEGDRRARVFGWAYRTLRGHVEEGQMDWMVWKWLDTGEVQFRVRAVSRSAPIPNPVIRLGFWALRGHERSLFLDSTDRRMRRFTELALGDTGGSDRVREAAPDLTARRFDPQDDSHEELARNVDRPD